MHANPCFATPGLHLWRYRLETADSRQRNLEHFGVLGQGDGGGIKPKCERLLGVGHCLFLGIASGSATWQFWEGSRPSIGRGIVLYKESQLHEEKISKKNT